MRWTAGVSGGERVKALALVALGGGFGAACRYLLSTAVMRVVVNGFPLGTLLVNLLGCLMIGIWAGLAVRHTWLDGELRLLLVSGVLGGFTTFSAFGLETLNLLRRGEMLLAGVYVGTSVALGLGLVMLGWWLCAGSAGR